MDTGSDILIEDLLRSAEERLLNQQLASVPTEARSLKKYSAPTETEKTVTGRPQAKEEKTSGDELAPRVLSSTLNSNNKKATEGAGSKWFNLPKTDLAPELKRDLQLLRLRGALDPKAHFKRQTAKSHIPRYCHVGQVIEGPSEYFSARLTRKERKKTLADEILSMEGLKKRSQTRFSDIQKRKVSGRRGYYKELVARRRRGGGYYK